MLAAAAAQHARGVRQMRETGRWPVAGGSVSMPIGLGLAAAPGEAVSAGPVWQGGGYWTATGSGYWSMPAFDATGEWELVLRATRPAGGSLFASGMRASSSNYTIGGYFSDAVSRNYIFTSGGLSLAYVDPDIRNNRTLFIGDEASGAQFKANVRVDDGTVNVASGALAAIGGSSVFVLGAYRDSGNGINPSSAGVKLWDATLYTRKLSTAERTAIRNLGVQIDPLSVVDDSVWDSWDFAQWNGTVVPGRVNGRNATPVNMTPTITTGATF